MLPPPRSTLFPYTTLFRSELLPDHVPAMVSMSEALLIENKTTEAAEYLDRAAKIDPSYWKAQALLAQVSLDRKSTRLNSSHRCISYAVFCLKKKKNN